MSPKAPKPRRETSSSRDGKVVVFINFIVIA
jgi:hypothetical protein